MDTRRAVGRRTFLKRAGAAAGVAVVGWPAVARAQAKALKIGAIHPVTGALAEIGQACRLGAEMAAEAVNVAGGIKSMGGAKLELLLGDTQNSPDVARSEAERLINDGAVLLTGAFHSGQTAAIVPVAQQRRVPFLIDIAAADSLTLNVARSVKEGKQKVQYVYRNFVTTATFGRKAVEFMAAIFKEAGVAPKRMALIYTNDLFGQTQAKQFQAAQKAMSPGFEIVEAIPFPENATDLSTEVSRAKAARPDVIAPVVRAVTAVLLLQEIARQRLGVMGIISPGTPGLYEKSQIDQLGPLIEDVMDNVPWPNFKSAETRRVADAFAKRSGGKTFDTNSGYSYEAILVAADVFERARSTDPDTIVAAIKATDYPNPLMVSAGPVRFNEIGDNANASTAMIQILKGRPTVVYPPAAAEARFVFPRPQA